LNRIKLFLLPLATKRRPTEMRVSGRVENKGGSA
jgi:hypothetical protein